MGIVTKTFSYTGATQTFVVPPVITSITIKAWGAAGGSRGGLGGPGGYSQGNLAVTTNQILSVIVGQGGTTYQLSGNGALNPTFGGGGGGGPCSEVFIGSSGGGRSSVILSDGTEIITAGGGGGSSSSNADTLTVGGSGGGLSGFAGAPLLACYNIMMGKGGTQSAGGAGGSGWVAFNNGVAGSQFTGGTGGGGSNLGSSAGSAGGGGGGYFGGGGGAGEAAGGNGCPPSIQSQDCSGGGGSGYIGGVLSGLTLATTITGGSGSPINPPFTTDSTYVAGVGVARSASAGGNGLVTISYLQPDLVLNKSVSQSYSELNNTLTYTIGVKNTGLDTVTNVVFVDTTPNGTTFNSGSLTIDQTPSSNNPNPPGFSLGNLAPGITTTVQFTVTIGSTIPSPNPMPNIATASYDGGFSFNSNTVTTKINEAIISATKSNNKTTATVGDIITYNIVYKNTGNATASSIIFIDTIPNGTSLVAGTLKQDTTAIAGSPNPPGVTLPNTLGVNRTTTVTFQVKINITPIPNPIPNTATASYRYTLDPSLPNGKTSSIGTNTVNTTIATASLEGITKYVDKSFSTCGDVITYTIVAPNSGTITAQNVVFKDTIPNGTVLVTDSVFVNGSKQLGANPSSGVSIPNIGPGLTATLSFSVQVQC